MTQKNNSTKREVRLAVREIQGIIESVRQTVPDHALKAIHLFGSRTDLQARGGDIDLWIECTTEPEAEWKGKVRRKLEDTLGEQKYDVVLSRSLGEEMDLHKKAFLELISGKKVTLWTRKKEDS